MIELAKISAGYGNKTVIRDISLSIPKGKVTTLIGPNGSGKSTVLKTIIGSIPPSAGTILADGVPASQISRSKLAKKIAYLPQEKGAASMTVGQLVLHGRFPHLRYPRRYGKTDYDITDRALAKMGLAALADKSVTSLSGGMRQNAYIAMALAQETDYIILDEPTTFQDIANQLRTMEMLRDLAKQGKGILAVLHDIPLAFTFSDKVAVLKDGELIAADTPMALWKEKVIPSVFGMEIEHSERHGYHYKFV